MNTKRARTGDPLEIPADVWNAVQDMVADAQTPAFDQSGAPLRSSIKPGMVFCKNVSGMMVSQFDAVPLPNLAMTPGFLTTAAPVFNIGSQKNETMLWGIACEPIAEGEVGRAVVSGIVMAMVNILNRDHEFAALSDTGLMSASSGKARILWQNGAGGHGGNQMCLLQLGGGGSGSGGDVCFARIWNGSADAGYSVDFYENGWSGGVTGSGVLYFPELALGADLPGGSRVVAHKIMLVETGGGE